MEKNKPNCWDTNDVLMAKYHDDEWGIPQHDDRKLFEFLILEGFQAGLSWSTILNKRETSARRSTTSILFESRNTVPVKSQPC